MKIELANWLVENAATVSWVWSPVVGLLFRRSPADIAWKISKIVIDSIDRFPWRASANISKKCSKTIFPLSAHSYTASAVIGELSRFRIKASAFNIGPKTIFARSNIVFTCLSMRLVDQCAYFPRKTTTASGMCGPKMMRLYNNLISAITHAKPMSTSIRFWGAFNNNQSVKSCSSEIN